MQKSPFFNFTLYFRPKERVNRNVLVSRSSVYYKLIMWRKYMWLHVMTSCSQAHHWHTTSPLITSRELPGCPLYCVILSFLSLLYELWCCWFLQTGGFSLPFNYPVSFIVHSVCLLDVVSHISLLSGLPTVLLAQFVMLLTTPLLF